MSIEKITSRILGEAAAERDILLAEAKAQSDAVLAEAEKQAAAMLEEAERRGEIEKEKIITRRRSVADIDCRKVFLAKKQEILADCFQKAVGEITRLPEEEYIALLVNLGKAAGVKEGLLRFNEKEKQSIAEKLVRMLQEAVPRGSFAVSEKTGSMQGGYLLISGQTTVNNTIEALVSEAQTALTAEAAQLLFSEDRRSQREKNHE